MNDLFEYPGFKVLSLFLYDPYEELHLNAVARSSGVSPSTAKRFLGFYEENGLVVKSKKANLTLFKGNVGSLPFRFIKLGVFSLDANPLFVHLKETYPASSITLYGSCARGEDSPDSDIDILVIGKPTPRPDLARYERKLGKKVNLLTYTPAEWEEKSSLDRAFYERVIVDGVAISGGVPVVAG
jgi:predicted nucleotidyltransferase